MDLHSWQARFLSSVKTGAGGEDLFDPPPAGTPGLGARIAVYANAYRIRTHSSLSEDFPLTRRLLGEKLFQESIEQFLASKCGYELELGALSPKFATFLRKRFSKASARKAAALDLLALEARVSPEEAGSAEKWGLCSSARFFAGPRRSYAIWREGRLVRRERITREEAAVLSCFLPEATLEELSARLEAGTITSPEQVQACVAKWVRLGLIHGPASH